MIKTPSTYKYVVITGMVKVLHPCVYSDNYLITFCFKCHKIAKLVKFISNNDILKVFLADSSQNSIIKVALFIIQSNILHCIQLKQYSAPWSLYYHGEVGP